MSEQKFDKVKYAHTYVRDHYDRIGLTVTKESKLKDRIIEQAERQKMSVNQWIVRAIEKELEWYE